MNLPLVSIIIPVYNREDLVIETLESISSQTYQNWECILVDDNSTDNSRLVIEKYIEKDNRFRLCQRPMERRKGANSCRNYGFERSKGLYVNWFDSDDIMHPNFIKNKVNKFSTEIDCVISKTSFFKNTIYNITGNETRTNQSNNLVEDFVTLKVSWYLPDPMWKRSFLKEKELFSEVLEKGQDRDFHIRILLESPNIRILDEYLTFYRHHENTISSNYSKEVIYSHFIALNNRIALFESIRMSRELKFFLLKQQTKNYPFLYKDPHSFFNFLRIFKKLFVLDIKNIIWFIKFIVASISLHITGKGSVILKG